MSRMLCGFFKGLTVGIVAGGMLGVLLTCYMHRNRRGLKRNVGHALHTVGDLADSVLGMF